MNSPQLESIPPPALSRLESQFFDVLSAVAYSILDSRLSLAASPSAPLVHNRAVLYVWRQWHSLPPHLGWPLLSLTLCLDASALARHGRRLRQLPLEARNRFLNRCRHSHWFVLRDWIHFFDALVLFAAISQLRDPRVPQSPAVP